MIIIVKGGYDEMGADDDDDHFSQGETGDKLFTYGEAVPHFYLQGWVKSLNMFTNALRS